MIVVSNASPLINLARVGRIDLLQQLYDELIIPEAVWQEVVIDGSGQPGALPAVLLRDDRGHAGRNV